MKQHRIEKWITTLKFFIFLLENLWGKGFTHQVIFTPGKNTGIYFNHAIDVLFETLVAVSFLMTRAYIYLISSKMPSLSLRITSKYRGRNNRPAPPKVGSNFRLAYVEI